MNKEQWTAFAKDLLDRVEADSNNGLKGLHLSSIVETGLAYDAKAKKASEEFKVGVWKKITEDILHGTPGSDRSFIDQYMLRPRPDIEPEKSPYIVATGRQVGKTKAMKEVMVGGMKVVGVSSARLSNEGLKALTDPKTGIFEDTYRGWTIKLERCMYPPDIFRIVDLNNNGKGAPNHLRWKEIGIPKFHSIDKLRWLLDLTIVFAAHDACSGKKFAAEFSNDSVGKGVEIFVSGFNRRFSASYRLEFGDSIGAFYNKHIIPLGKTDF